MPEVSLGEMEVKLQVIAFIRHLSLGTLSSGLSSRINSSRDSNVFKFYHTIFSYLRRNLWSWTMYCRHSYLVSAFCPLPQSHSLWDFFLRHYGIFYETIWMEDGPQTKTQKKCSIMSAKNCHHRWGFMHFCYKEGLQPAKKWGIKEKETLEISAGDWGLSVFWHSDTIKTHSHEIYRFPKVFSGMNSWEHEAKYWECYRLIWLDCDRNSGRYIRSQF